MSIWWLLGLVPKNLLSRFVGRIVRRKWPRWIVRRFAEHFKIRLDEAEFPFEEYPTIQALFTRRLKSGIRPVADGPFVHPVDGVLTMAGPITSGACLQAKGISFKVDQFLGDSDLAWSFQDGFFFTYYLCPTDYHRVHSPWSGRLEKLIHMPGTLWPVNPWSVSNVPGLFAINERLHFILRTEFGPAVVGMVGATNVGEMTTPWAPNLVTNRAREAQTFQLPTPQTIRAGEELGTFNMGSTVVLLLPASARSVLSRPPTDQQRVDQATLMGQRSPFV